MRESKKIIVWLIALVLFQQAFGQTSSEDGFVLVKEEKNIRIYERWVTFPSSSPSVKAREVKGEFFVDTEIHHALALIRDETRIKFWQKHVSEFRVYPQNDTLWYEYSYHDIPWPVSDQDHFLEYQLKRSSDGKELFITFKSFENKDLAPERKSATRMELCGSWHIKQVHPGKLKIVYSISSMPGSLPRFLTDPVIRSNLMSTIKSYVALLERNETP